VLVNPLATSNLTVRLLVVIPVAVEKLSVIDIYPDESKVIG
jgi:hypothetical protein